MNHHRPVKPAAKTGSSLLERASDLYGLDNALKGGHPVVPPLPESARNAPPMAAPAPAPTTVATPVQAAAPAPSPAPVQAAAPVTAPAPPAPTPADLARRAVARGPVQAVDRERLEVEGFIVPGGSVSGLAEEFRIVKREILNAIRGTAKRAALPMGRRVLLASANPDDGKTFCAVNLALSLAAESDHEVLLVDADFAKPSVVEALGLTDGPGLMDALSDDRVSVTDFVIATDVPGLMVLPAGKATNRDTELLASARTATVLAALEAGAPNRIVIFDSPPVLAASPATALAAHVGQLVMVVRADKTTEAALRDSIQLMSGCSHIQLLLNGVKFSPGGRRFGTYYGKGD